MFHFLPESESFSEHQGGAISRWVANILRYDENAQVVTGNADESWALPSDRVHQSEALAGYRRTRPLLARSPLWAANRWALSHILRPLAKQLRPGDLAWVHNRPDFAVGIQNSVREAGAKLVLHMHNSHLTYCPRDTVARLSADKYIFCSQFLANEAFAKLPHIEPNSAVLYNGADDNLFFPADKTKQASAAPQILFVGRLIPEKGLHIFVDAMRMLGTWRCNGTAAIIGSAGLGPETAQTKYLRRLRGDAPANVQFLEYRVGKSLAEKFQEADIFCAPSIFQEPFGMVNVEAMACGVPVVATNVGGIPEVLSQGGGVLVPPNSAEDLARALQKLANDSALRLETGKIGLRSYKERFTWRAIARDYHALVATVSNER